ncbi:MAG TPA: FAD-dependent oxidoreductase [Candidatus Dormibacteraeota bacterium]|nr:FAD-dependent oxidoreductase [Candidatus Dormibacteraeota bacterium]
MTNSSGDSTVFEMPTAREIELDLALASPGWQSLLKPRFQPWAASTDGTRAVVIGGGIAGLMAAHVLAGRFDRVTIVDRDTLPAEPRFRDGVPQSRHLHGLLRGGLDVMERLYPGLESELLGAGAVSINGNEFLRLSAAGWSKRFDSPALTAASRELIEWAIRRRTLQHPNVHVLDEQQAIGLIASADGTAVMGIQVRGHHTRAITPLHADLVVDASGRNSTAPEWLDALGYGRPKETVINSFLGYASCLFAIPERFTADWKIALIGDKPPAMPRVGVLAPIEGNRWMVTLGGYARDYPPTDREGFLEFARSLRSDLIYAAIRAAEPLSRISGFRATTNRRRHFEQMSRWPQRFVVLGDAACAFNPVYGQGMSVAAKTVASLERALNDVDRPEFARRMQLSVAKTATSAWVMATGADVRYPTTEGRQPSAADRLVQRYVDRVIAVSMQDATVNEAFRRVVNLIDEPGALFRPQVLWRTFTVRREPILEAPSSRVQPTLRPVSA